VACHPPVGFGTVLWFGVLLRSGGSRQEWAKSALSCRCPGIAPAGHNVVRWRRPQVGTRTPRWLRWLHASATGSPYRVFLTSWPNSSSPRCEVFGKTTVPGGVRPLPTPGLRRSRTFFDGKPFTAATTSGTQFKMIFTADGKMTRQPRGKSGKRSSGTLKLDTSGFCTSWKGAESNCYTVVPSGKNKWSIQKGSTAVAVWSK
jgi:hypothetical protein